MLVQNKTNSRFQIAIERVDCVLRYHSYHYVYMLDLLISIRLSSLPRSLLDLCSATFVWRRTSLHQLSLCDWLPITLSRHTDFDSVNGEDISILPCVLFGNICATRKKNMYLATGISPFITANKLG